MRRLIVERRGRVKLENNEQSALSIRGRFNQIRQRAGGVPHRPYRGRLIIFRQWRAIWRSSWLGTTRIGKLPRNRRLSQTLFRIRALYSPMPPVKTSISRPPSTAVYAAIVLRIDAQKT